MQLHSTHFTPACIAFIKQWQGLSLEKYQDKKGIWVIGYGTKSPQMNPLMPQLC